MRQSTTRLFVVAVLALAGISAGGETRQGSIDPALRKAADARTAARIASDASAFARYTLDDAIIVSPAGVLTPMQDRLNAMKTAKPVATPPKRSDERYRVFGETAVRTYREDGINPEGQKVAPRYLEVWIKQGGEWKLAAVQVTPITQP